MADERIKAWCYGDGLINFGDQIPSDAFPISDGGPGDMAIVRRLAHEDGNSYWVPGIRDGRDWKGRIKAFSEACTEHLDDGIPRYTADDWAALQRRAKLSTGRC